MSFPISSSDFDVIGGWENDVAQPLALCSFKEITLKPYSVWKTDIKSLDDLSDIDISQHPSLKLRWTLSRNSASDSSPMVSNPSITWEGAQSGGFYEKIADITLTDVMSMVDFEGLNLEDYKYLKLMIVGTIQGDLNLRFNNDSSNSYEANNASSYNFLHLGSLTYDTNGSASVAKIEIDIEHLMYDKYKSVNAIKNQYGATPTQLFAGRWKKMSNFIDSISCIANPNFHIGANFMLWGVKR